MMIRHAIVLWLFLGPVSAAAATCTWNTPTGNWSVPANWTGCADTPGPSTRAPGPGDIAVVPSGQADLDTNATVAEFEIAASGIVSSLGSGALRTLSVASALRLNGGKITTQLGQNQLLIVLPVGATGNLLAPTTFENATFLENSGTLALGSTSGVALSLLVAAQLRNMPGGTISFAGGDSRLVIDSSAELVNNVDATLAITGNMIVSRPPAAFTVARLRNFGNMTVTGPGTLNLALGANATFQQSGHLIATSATIICDRLNGERCNFGHIGTSPTGIVTRLDNAVLDLGGATSDLGVPVGTTLTGTGSINARVLLNGVLAPGALTGLPHGELAFSGGLQVNPPGVLDVDLSGSTPGSYDRVVLAGTMTVGGSFTPGGNGVLNLRLASGYQPALDTSVAIVGYPSFESLSSFRRVDANYILDYAARFDPGALQVFPAPRISIEDASVVEGNSGDVPAVFNVRLSQASTQTVTTLIDWSNGTANSGSTPNGDFAFPGTLGATFAPGQTLQTLPIQVHGDTVAEADEGFSLSLVRNRVVNAAFGTGVAGNVVASGTIITDDLPPGTRFLLVGKDENGGGNRIRRYTTTGTFIDTWGPFESSTLGHVASGLCFSPEGNILSTRFAAPRPVYYSAAGAVLDSSFGVIPGHTALQNDESCAFDLAGNVYIGQAIPAM